MRFSRFQLKWLPMSYNIRHFSAIEDYPIISSWWLRHEWPVIPLTHLSSSGFICELDGVPAVAGWIYETNSAFCLLEFVVANPEIRREKRTEAFEAFLEAMVKYSKEAGFSTIFTTVKSGGLMGRLENQGFQKSDVGMTNMVRIL